MDRIFVLLLLSLLSLDSDLLCYLLVSSGQVVLVKVHHCEVASRDHVSYYRILY